MLYCHSDRCGEPSSPGGEHESTAAHPLTTGMLYIDAESVLIQKGAAISKSRFLSKKFRV
jgi:hypothetical protein